MRKLSLKRVSVVLVIVVLMGSMLTYGAPRRMAVVTEVKGTVKIKKSGGERKINAFKGMNLSEGDTLIIGSDGQMTLKLDDDKEIILNANTTMNIQDLKEKNGNQVTTLNQTRGSSVTKIDNKLTAGSSFQQRTPTAIMGVRGTLWSTEQNEQGTTNVVVDGTVSVSIPQSVQGEAFIETLIEKGFSVQIKPDAKAAPRAEAIDWKEVNPFVVQTLVEAVKENPDLLEGAINEGLQNFVKENPQVLEKKAPENTAAKLGPSYAPVASSSSSPAVSPNPSTSTGGGGGGGSSTPSQSPSPSPILLNVSTPAELLKIIGDKMTITEGATAIHASSKRVFVGVESEAIDMQQKLKSFLKNEVIATTDYTANDNYFAFQIQGMGANSDEKWELFIFRNDAGGALNKNQIYGVSMTYGETFLKGIVDNKTNESTIIVPDDYVFPEEKDSEGIKAINESIHAISYPTTTVELTGEIIMDEEERPCYRGTFNVNNGKNTYYVTVRKAYTEAVIEEFTIGGQLGETRFVTNEETGDPTIEIYMPEDTDLDQVIPQVTTLKGASYTLSSTDFSQPVTCTVTAEDQKSSNIYTVRVYPYGEPKLLTVTIIDDVNKDHEYPISSKITTLYIPAITTVQESYTDDPWVTPTPIYTSKPDLSATYSEGSSLQEMTRVYPSAVPGDEVEMTATYKLQLPNNYTQEWQITLVRDLFTVYPENEEGGVDYSNPLLSGMCPEATFTTGTTLYFKSMSNDIGQKVKYDKIGGVNPTQGVQVPQATSGGNEYTTLIFNRYNDVEAGHYRFYYEDNEEKTVDIYFK